MKLKRDALLITTWAKHRGEALKLEAQTGHVEVLTSQKGSISGEKVAWNGLKVCPHGYDITLFG